MKLKMIAISVSSLFIVPNAWADFETTCEKSTGCHYSNQNGQATNWLIDGHDVQNENKLKINLLPKKYQNEAVTKTGLNDDGSYEINSLISLHNYHQTDDVHAVLTVPKGAVLTLENAYDDNYLIALQGKGMHADVAAGAQLIVKPNYAQQQGIPATKREWRAGSALRLSDQATAHNAADIVLNGQYAKAFNLDGLSQLDASQHTITMNGDANEGVHVGDYAKANLDQVTITGAGQRNVGVSAYHDGDFSSTPDDRTMVKLNRSQINLSHPDTSVGVYLSDASVEVNDGSKIQAAYGLITAHDFISGKNIIDVNNSEVIGKKALYAGTPELLRKSSRVQAINSDVNIHANHSILTGKTILDSDLRQAGNAYGKVAMSLKNNSIWNIQDNSELDQLHLDTGSMVNLRHAESGQYNTLTINGDLTGEGVFRLNTDIAGNKADKLWVKGKASGKHILDIANTTTEPTTTDGKLTVVQTGGSGEDTFRLPTNQLVSAGKYLYGLEKVGNDWQLAYVSNAQPKPETKPTQPDTPKPTPPVQPEKPQPITPAQPETPKPTQPITPPIVPPSSTQRYFSYPVMNALAALNVAEVHLQKQNQALNMRQADLHQQAHTQGLWSQAEGGVSKRAADTLASGSRGETANVVGFKQKDTGFTLGYDYRWGNAYVGALVGQGRHHIDFDGNLYRNITLRSRTVALYGGATWGQGWFVDGTLRHNHYRYDASNSPVARDAFHVNSLNVQVGKQVDLNPTWSIVPQTAITLGRLSGSHVLKNSTLVQTRTGADVQGQFALANGAWLKPKVGLYYLGDHHHTRLKVNSQGETLHAPTSGNRIAAKVGMDMDFRVNNRFGVNLYHEYGHDVKRPFGVEMGFRHEW